jgi:hypothetical protein
MFLRFDISKVLSLYEQDKLDKSHINYDAVPHLDKWTNFVDLLMQANLVRIDNNLTTSRYAYSLIDRTKSIPSIVKTHIEDEQLIPTGKPKSLNLLDICLDRASEILKTDKPINILWSGGVDSTVALFALMRQVRNINQLSIVCTFESILESGGLFDALIKDSGIRIKFDQTRRNTNLPFTFDNEDPTQLYITGQCADQLFANPRFLKIKDTPQTDPWYSGYDKKLLDLIEPSLKFSSRPIETVYDFRWWSLFNYTWTTVLYDDYVDRPLNMANRINSFYATPEFQRWAMYTPTHYESPNLQDSPHEHKTPLKKVLGKLIDYPYYIQNKKKGYSFTWKKNNNWYLLDKSFKTYYMT